MQKKNTTVEDQHEATIETLRRAFERRRPDYRPAEGETRVTLVNSLNQLAKLAGIERGERTRAELYEEAACILGGRDKSEAVDYVQFLCATVQQEWARHPRSAKYINRLKQRWYDIGTTLRRAISEQGWEAYGVTTDEERDEIVREITALAKEAGVEHEAEPGIPEGFLYEKTYINALKNFGGTDNGSAHGARLKELAAEIDERVHAAKEKEQAAKGTPRKSVIVSAPGRRTGRVNIDITRDCLRCVGLVKGDTVKALPAADLKPGDVAAVRSAGESHFNLGRVVAAGATHITLKDDAGEFTRERASLDWVGRVDHKNPTKADPLSEDDRARVDELREKIDRLGNEDDQILRCTARYKYEKEIFDIEHPAGSDPDDWSAWEE